MWGKNLYHEGGDALQYTTQGIVDAPSPVRDGQAGWSSEHSGRVKGVTAHGRGLAINDI